MPIPVPNQNLAASPLQLFAYVTTGEITNNTVFQHKPTVWFCQTSRTIQFSNYCQPAEFLIKGEQDSPKETNQ